jgi:hypothetical protein
LRKRRRSHLPNDFFDGVFGDGMVIRHNHLRGGVADVQFRLTTQPLLVFSSTNRRKRRWLVDAHHVFFFGGLGKCCSHCSR